MYSGRTSPHQIIDVNGFSKRVWKLDEANPVPNERVSSAASAPPPPSAAVTPSYPALAQPLAAIKQHADYAHSVINYLSSLDTSNEALQDDIQDALTKLGASIDVIHQQLKAAEDYLEHYITADEVGFDEGDPELMIAIDEVLDSKKRLSNIIAVVGIQRPQPSLYHHREAALERARDLMPGAVVQHLDDGRISLVNDEVMLTIGRTGNVVVFENNHVRFDARGNDFPVEVEDGTAVILQGSVTGYLTSADAHTIGIISTGRRYSSALPPRNSQLLKPSNPES